MPTSKEVEEVVLKIFSSVLGIQDFNEMKNLTYGQSEIWDSLAFMEIFILVENVFKLTIPEERIASLKSVENFIDLVAEHSERE